MNSKSKLEFKQKRTSTWKTNLTLERSCDAKL